MAVLDETEWVGVSSTSIHKAIFMPSPEEDHAMLTLSRELGVSFQHHDDGSSSGMPDLFSSDGMHVAEVITTAESAVRESEKHLHPVPELTLPHCVWILIPYAILGGTTRQVRGKIVEDVRRWVAQAGCTNRWASHDHSRARDDGINPAPIQALGVYDNGVQALCVQQCQHSSDESHQITWTVTHEATPLDPWSLIRRSLRIVDREQRGGVHALAEKLNVRPHKHLVIYPFGPPGNLTAAFSGYEVQADFRSLLPPQLIPPLTDVHLWLLYKYGDGDGAEGLHVCNGHWHRFGTGLPSLDLTSLRRFHYGEA